MCLVLAVVTVFVYQGVRGNDFFTYDDLDYVLENRQVQQGVTMHSMAWAFTTFHAIQLAPADLDFPHGGLEPLWQ